MATSFQILPTANRPTVTDAISGLIDTIQGHQAEQHKQDALVAYQQQRLQQQAQSDAADRQNELADTASERANDQIDSAVERFDKLDNGEKKAVYRTLPPEVQRRIGYDPMALPDEQPEGPKPMSELDKAKLAQNERFHRDRMGAQAQTRAAADKRSAPKQPNYADPSGPDFEEHPAVKDYNDKLRKLTTIGQQIMSDQVSVRDEHGATRPLTAQEKAVRLHAINTTINDLVKHRSTAVGALRAHGVKVAQAPDDTFYAGQGAPQQGGAPQGGDEPEPDDNSEEEGQEQAQGKPLDAQTAANFVKMANGDNNKARALAQAAGYSIGGQ